MSRRPRAAAAVAVLLVAGACTGGGDRPPVSMRISPPGQFDELAEVTLEGLSGGARTTVTATATDVKGVRWTASADFRADARGTLSLDQAPVDGYYPTADPMGLVEALAPADPAVGLFQAPPRGSYDITLTATVDGRTVADGTLHRLTPAEAGVTSTTFRPGADGIFGVAYRPQDTSRKRTAVLLFGGSEGGLLPVVTLQAALLAAHGHPTLALAYFGVPGLPARLDRIPLEYFVRALSVLRAQPGVNPHRVYVMGASRGGEAALLLGATFPDLVDGVVAQVPAATVAAVRPRNGHSSWTLHGRDVPATDFIGVPADVVQPAAAVIPVERITGPVLLTCGGLDLVWPSCNQVSDIAARLEAHHFQHPVTVLSYDDAGHLASSLPPYTNYTDALLTDTGGSQPGTQAANVDFHDKLLALLGS